MTGTELANRVIKQFGRQSANEIAALRGLSVRFERWYPVTAGEFVPAQKKIIVNESAKIDPQRIIAHELGHYFLVYESISSDNDEKFCDEFAEALLGGGASR